MSISSVQTKAFQKAQDAYRASLGEDGILASFSTNPSPILSEVAEAIGVKTMIVDFPAETRDLFSAFCMPKDGAGVIFINAALGSDERMVEAMAHELGHIIVDGDDVRSDPNFQTNHALMQIRDDLPQDLGAEKLGSLEDLRLSMIEETAEAFGRMLVLPTTTMKTLIEKGWTNEKIAEAVKVTTKFVERRRDDPDLKSVLA
jgi:Zn-dependent peptidase ImmA (M78 family)